MEPVITMHDAGEDDVAGRPGWTGCPGCGVMMPTTGAAGPARRNASAECWSLYGEIAGFELANMAVLGRWHQMMVDTYGAQHAGADTKPITVAFGLIGLQLTLDDGWTGVAVRAAHQMLAERSKRYPVFVRPSGNATLTVEDVALVGSIDDRVSALRQWAESVWAWWAPAHDAVRALIHERLSPEDLARLRATRT